MATENTEYGTHTLHSALRTLLPRLLLLVGALLIVIWGGRVLRAGLSLREHLRQARALVDAPGKADLLAACDLVSALRADVETLQREAGWLVRAAPALGWLPGVGSDLRAAPHLLAVADDLTLAGTTVCNELSPLLNAVAGDEGTVSPEQVVRGLADARPELERALAAVERAQGTWADVDVSRLSARTARWAATVDRMLPFLRAGLELAVIAPDLLGADGPRTYLILAQNEDELRPTGGFISGAIRLTLDRGRITEIVFHDANLVDDYARKPYPEPPAPLLHYMGSELWLFRDANWSPDFPTSARQAAHLYEYGQGVSVDGVFALDQRALELLLAGWGEVEVDVAGISISVTSENIRQFMHEAWNPPEDGGVNEEWIFSRKNFIGQLADALLKRMEESPKSVDWLQVFTGMYHALQGRHLLIFVNDSRSANILNRVGWDGSLRDAEGDYLMVVDANLGFGKINPLIKRKISYHLTLRVDGTAEAKLSLTYIHQGQQKDVHCQHLLPYVGDITYEKMMNRCYYNYLRVYTPAGSTLHSATPHPTPGEYLLRGEPDPGQAVTLDEESGKTVFAQFFVVEYGHTLTTRFEYELPPIVRPRNGYQYYSLWIQKQPGTDDIPTSLTINLPPGTHLIGARPTPLLANDELVKFALTLDTDILVEVWYER